MHVAPILALFAAAPVQSHAYQHTTTHDGQVVRWGRPIVTVGTTHLESAETRAAVAHAVTEWAKAAAPGLDVRLARAQTPDVLVSSVPDEAWQMSSDFLALTSVHHDHDGRIIHAQIELKRSQTQRETQTYDLEAVIAHELGHALGMAHELQVTEATMSPTLTPGPSHKRYLHDDDIQGIKDLYPLATEGWSCGSTPAVPRNGTMFATMLALGAVVWLRLNRGETL